MSDLGTLGGGESLANAINDAGQVMGFSTVNGESHAFLYSNGQMMDLGTLPGASEIQPLGLNNAGQVVGYAYRSTGGQHAFLYSNGQMFDLNDLINPALNITLQEASAINDSGQIIANGANRAGEGRAYLLTPVPEPSTLVLFGVALLGLGAWIRAHRSRS